MTGALTPRETMGLIEQALHFPFLRLGVSDFPLQRLVILMACDAPAGHCETGQLMERLPTFTKASMSRHLKALNQLGLVEPREVAEDLRRKTWHLTRRGKRFMSDWKQAVWRASQAAGDAAPEAPRPPSAPAPGRRQSRRRGGR